MSDERAPTPAGDPTDDPIVRRVRQLVDLAKQHDLAELSIQAADFRLKVRSRASGPVVSRGPSAADEQRPPATAAEPAGPPPLLVAAPMIGTFYEAAAPGEAPFVAVGDRIELGQVVAIIEAMKIMNEIQSDQAGILAEVLVRNGQGVEFGQPLFRLQPAEA